VRERECVCVSACGCVREREGEREKEKGVDFAIINLRCSLKGQTFFLSDRGQFDEIVNITRLVNAGLVKCTLL